MMKKGLRKVYLILMFLIVALMLSSCASLGPKFQKVETLQKNKGLVYIYRPKKFVGGGVSYTVAADQTPVTKLYNGGYYPYFSNPGEIEFWAKTEAKSSVTLDVKPGKTYYIRGTVTVGALVGRPHLMIVEPSIGEVEIKECNLIPEKKE